MVHLFDELVKTIPDGGHLMLDEAKWRHALDGVAQSNVATYAPRIAVDHASGPGQDRGEKKNERALDFGLSVKLTNPDEAKGTGKRRPIRGNEWHGQAQCRHRHDADQPVGSGETKQGQAMKLSDFRNLDFNNIGGWAHGVKLTFCALLFGSRAPCQRPAGRSEAKADKAPGSERVSNKQAKVVNLDAQSSSTRCATFAPVVARIAEQDGNACWWISSPNRAAFGGFQTQLFQPGAESIKEGFAGAHSIARPTGTYHQFGASSAAWPRCHAGYPYHARCIARNPLRRPSVVAGGTVRTYRARRRRRRWQRAEEPAAGRKIERAHRSHIQTGTSADGAALALLAGCTGGMGDLQQWVAQEKAKGAGSAVARVEDIRDVCLPGSGQARSVRAEP